MTFPYIRYGVFYRPVLPIIFIKGRMRLPYEALIDTGADISVIHGEFARQLGINVERGENIDITGIAGKAPGYIHRIDIAINKVIFVNVPVVFTDAIAPQGFGILGHEGFFNRVKIIFNFAKKEFEVILLNDR